MADTTSMGKRLRAARLNKDISLTELAKRVGSQSQIIGDYERGRRGSKRPDIGLLVRICDQLDISIDWLFLGKQKNK